MKIGRITYFGPDSFNLMACPTRWLGVGRASCQAFHLEGNFGKQLVSLFMHTRFRIEIVAVGLLLCVMCANKPVWADNISAGTVTVDPSSLNVGTLTNALLFGGPITTQLPVSKSARKTLTFPTATGISSNRGASGNINGLDFFTPGLLPFSGTPVIRMSLTVGGRLGIGITNPSRAVEVDGAGDVEIGLKSTDANGRLWTLQSSAAVNSSDASLDSTFQIIDRTAGLSRLKISQDGTVAVNVLQILGGSDLAEPFQMQNKAVERGSVVVIDDKAPGQLKPSTQPYDTRVAGIVSGAGGVHTGLSLQQHGLDDGQNVALSGRVYALADASEVPIQPGDLLTTSFSPGRCMKAADKTRAQGAILGKAMSPLAHGQGMILVLVGLQ